MNRRWIIQGGLAIAASGLISACVGARSQPQLARPFRIAYLLSGSLDSSAASLEAFRQGMRDLGYAEGQDYTLEIRAADGRDEHLPALAAEVVKLDPRLILTGGREAIGALRDATSTVPIVFASAGDPVAEGFVESIARPGGNATGLTLGTGNVYPKRLQLLKEVVPGLSRVAVLRSQGSSRDYENIVDAGAMMGIEVLTLALSGPDDFDLVATVALDGHADGLIVITDAIFMALAPRIVAFAAVNRLPAMYGTSTYMRAGGLMFYGVNIPENYRRAAAHVDRILKGANPAEIPVEQPTKFDFAVNLQVARALGLTIPQSVLSQATEIIQ
jgi:putative ABC transport system substrate-binding protein